MYILCAILAMITCTTLVYSDAFFFPYAQPFLNTSSFIENQTDPKMDVQIIPIGSREVDKRINFSASVIDPGRNITSYTWNFDDGIIKSGSLVNHVYKKPNIYNVQL